MIKRIFAMVLVFVTVCSFTGCVAAKKADDKVGESLPGETQTLPTEEEITDQELFRQFLAGDIRASLELAEYDLQCTCIDYDYDAQKYVYLFPDQATLSFEELQDTISGTPRLNTEKMVLSYSVFHTRSDRPVLALRAMYLDIFGPGDDSYALFLFAVKDDRQLAMTYAYDSWGRSTVTVNNDLIFTGWGSGGAAVNYTWCYYIDDTGHKQVVYETEHRFTPDGYEEGLTQEEMDAAYEACGIDQSQIEPFDNWIYIN